MSETPQIRLVGPAWGNINILWDNVKVESLVICRLKVENMSDITIKDIDLSIFINPFNNKEKIKFLEIQLNDPLDKTSIASMINDDGKHGMISLKRDFINPSRNYPEEALNLTVITNTKLLFMPLAGGDNWYIRERTFIKYDYEDHQSKEEKIDKNTKTGLRFTLLGLIPLIFALYFPQNSTIQNLLLIAGCTILTAGMIIYLFTFPLMFETIISSINETKRNKQFEFYDKNDSEKPYQGYYFTHHLSPKDTNVDRRYMVFPRTSNRSSKRSNKKRIG
jgi:hypothetical protein